MNEISPMEGLARGIVQGQQIANGFLQMQNDALAKRKLELELDFAPRRFAAELTRIEAETRSAQMQQDLLSRYGVRKAELDLAKMKADVNMQDALALGAVAEQQKAAELRLKEAEAKPFIFDMARLSLGDGTIGGRAAAELEVIEQFKDHQNEVVRNEVGKVHASYLGRTYKKLVTVDEGGMTTQKYMDFPLAELVSRGLSQNTAVAERAKLEALTSSAGFTETSWNKLIATSRRLGGIPEPTAKPSFEEVYNKALGARGGQKPADQDLVLFDPKAAEEAALNSSVAPISDAVNSLSDKAALAKRLRDKGLATPGSGTRAMQYLDRAKKVLADPAAKKAISESDDPVAELARRAATPNVSGSPMPTAMIQPGGPTSFEIEVPDEDGKKFFESILRD